MKYAELATELAALLAPSTSAWLIRLADRSRKNPSGGLRFTPVPTPPLCWSLQETRCCRRRRRPARSSALGGSESLWTLDVEDMAYSFWCARTAPVSRTRLAVLDRWGALERKAPSHACKRIGRDQHDSSGRLLKREYDLFPSNDETVARRVLTRLVLLH